MPACLHDPAVGTHIQTTFEDVFVHIVLMQCIRGLMIICSDTDVDFLIPTEIVRELRTFTYRIAIPHQQM